ncbi:MAG: Flp pilus assembly protein CpaB [Rhodocyclales bacterium]|nr:Flp pilus assembly protein CpaB [Rhodocyclales bacterium]
MKNMKAIVMIGISVVAGLVAVLAAARWVSQQSAVSTNRLAVAVVDMQVGQQINPEMIKLVDWPRDSMPAGGFSDLTTLAGRVTKMGVGRGEPILESKLAPVGSRAGLSALIASGKRAMTVRVNEVVGVAGFALPGNYVDIMVNTQEEGGQVGDKERQISKIVLEHILVLAVAQEASRDESKPKVVNAVTLEVTPEEAEKLDLARSVGSLSLVLRNQVEAQAVKTVGATKGSLLSDKLKPSPAEVKAEAPKPERRRSSGKAVQSRNCVQVLRGTQSSLECF